MKNDDVRRYLLDKKEDIKRLPVKGREINLPFTEAFIISLVGPRRAGKTYIMYDIIRNRQKLRDEEFIFVNFENAEISGIAASGVKELINTHEQIYGRKPLYLFFDEIQALKGWERAVNSLYESKRYRIFLSGSSSKVLSKEIATMLRGRSLAYLILPFSFSEFLAVQGIKAKTGYLSSSEENMLKRSLRSYMSSGGFPDAVLSPETADKFYRDYLDLVVFKDIMERYKIKNPALVKFLMNSSLASFGKLLSLNNLFLAAKSAEMEASKNTLYVYNGCLEESFFIFLIKKFSFSAKKSESSMPKLYLNDTGLKSIIKSPGEDAGRLYENIAFLHLKRMQAERPLMDIFYYRIEPQDYEVDFVVTEKSKPKQLIQVSVDVSGRKAEERELRALITAGKELKCNNLLVLTESGEKEKNVSWFGIKKKVKFMPLWKWLLKGSKTIPA
ncbi:MAG: ATP-binding protein [Candidatus Nanoarchaeia archaeon]|nr:ATP-binding protein [Candidatus Nanoarchaeia archaeon]